MKTRLAFKIKDPLGLHLRPAKDMAQIFLENGVEALLIYETQHINAKSPISLLTLAAPCDSQMVLEVTGESHERAIESFKVKFAEWMEPVE